jgi:hypothetical protein
MTRDHAFIMIKASIHPEDTKLINIYASKHKN